MLTDSLAPDDRPGRLEQAVLEWMRAEDRGEVLDPTSLLSRYADVADDLKDYLLTADAVVGCSSDAAGARAFDRTASDQHANNTPSCEMGSFPAKTSAFMLPPQALAPDFELLEMLASGGMGVIYKARNVALDRIVALKVILLGDWASAEDRSRFQVEARALAKLRHPAIVSVYSAGELKGRPYLEMEFITGRTLQGLIDESPLDAREAAQIVHQIALGIQEAHESDVLHRDLKPSNVLLDNSRQPHVTDFGLAKILSDRDDLTVTGQVIGTPCYMSPEQAGGDGAIGPATDVYGLGAILYAAIAGQPPFRTPSTAQTLRLVHEQDPPAPRLLNPSVPRDLETICLKCLRKETLARYPSAQAVAEELQRFLEGEPIKARPAGIGERSVRWARRNPFSATVLGLLACCVISGAAGLFVHLTSVGNLNARLADRNRDLSNALTAAKTSRQQERSTADRLQRFSYAADMRLALDANRRKDARQVADLLGNHMPQDGRDDIRCFLWHYLSRVTPQPLQTLARLDQACYFAVWSPAGDLCAVCGADGFVRIFDKATGRLLVETDSGQKEVNSVAFHPQRPLLASAGDDGTVRLWKLPSPADFAAKETPIGTTPAIDKLTLEATLQLLEGRPVYGVAFTPDGRSLVACGDNPDLQIWDVGTHTRRTMLGGQHQRRVEALAISPDGRRLISVGRDSIAILWDLESETAVRRLEGSSHPLTSVAFLQDGPYFATGGIGGGIRLWSSNDGQYLAYLRRPDAIQQIATVDQTHVLVSDRGGMVSLVKCTTAADAGSLETVTTWHADSDRIYGLAAHPTERTFMTASRSGRVNRWSLNIKPDVIQLGGLTQTHNPHMMVFPAASLRSGEILTCSWNALVRHDLTSQVADDVITAGSELFVSCDARPDESLIAAVERPNIVHARKIGGKAQTFVVGDPEDFIMALRLSPNSNVAILRRRYGALQTLDLASGTVKNRVDDCNALASPSGTDLLWIAEKGTNLLVAIDIKHWAPLHRIQAHRDAIRAVVVSPDATQVAATGNDRSLSVWDTKTGTLLRRIESLPATVTALAWSPDGLTIAACDEAGTIRLFQSATLREIGVLFRAPHSLCSVEFTPDNRWLYAVDDHLKIYAFDGKRVSVSAP